MKSKKKRVDEERPYRGNKSQVEEAKKKDGSEFQGNGVIGLGEEQDACDL